jgi:hypothetical protein
MKSAILITGELRFEDENHFNKFYSLVENYDIFIATHPKYEWLAKQITNKYILSDVQLPQGNMYQWYHLNQLISNWKDLLLTYDVLIKLRTDINYTKYTFDNFILNENTIYAQTDQIFYGKSSHFINCYIDMFNNVLDLYIKESQHNYIPINYYNLLNSDSESDVKFAWLTLPKEIYNNDINKLQENISNTDINYLTKNAHTMDMEFGQRSGYAFTSERCFLIQSINKGLIGKSKIVGSLIPNRKENSWGIL